MRPDDEYGWVAWREFSDDSIALPRPTDELVACNPISITEEPHFATGDVVCDGSYVWQCEKGDLCNTNLPLSEECFSAWSLINGLPDPIEEVYEEADFEEEYIEPSEKDLLSMMDRIPLEPNY